MQPSSTLAMPVLRGRRRPMNLKIERGVGTKGITNHGLYQVCTCGHGIGCQFPSLKSRCWRGYLTIPSFRMTGPRGYECTWRRLASWAYASTSAIPSAISAIPVSSRIYVSRYLSAIQFTNTFSATAGLRGLEASPGLFSVPWKGLSPQLS